MIEPEYFSGEIKKSAQGKAYEDLFTIDASVHKITLEDAPSYSKFPKEKDVAKKIFEYGVKPKFIYLLRNPFDRIESHYNFMKSKSNNSQNWNLDIGSSHLINLSNYYLQLKQYEPYFEKKDFLLIDFGRIKQNPEAVLKEIYRFLDLPETYFPEEYYVENKLRQKSSLERSVRKNFGKLIPLIPRFIRRNMENHLRKKNPVEKKRLTEEQKKSIHQELKPNMLKLQKEYDFDVSKWGFVLS